jgi:pantoate--beta-alanine ligase
MPKPTVIRTVRRLRQAIAGYRKAGDTIALIPTMGALHAGHVALVRLAGRKAKRVIVSIFVNPAQFAPHEDFASYPRTLKHDLAALGELKVDLIWAPDVREMYPDGFATRIDPAGPAKAGLEDAFRPHFFGGVATVVAKLLQHLDMPVTIVGAPTVREKDGLAMSSRNAYLSESERAVAPILHRVLKECAARIEDGQPVGAALGDGRTKIERAGFTLDYLEARDARTLAPISDIEDAPMRLLVAAKLGRTRLIDNIKV